MSFDWFRFARSMGGGLLALLLGLVLPAAWSLGVFGLILDRGPGALVRWQLVAALLALAAPVWLAARHAALRAALEQAQVLDLVLLLVLQFLASGLALMTALLEQRPESLLALPVSHLPAALLTGARHGWRSLLGAAGALFLLAVPFFAAAALAARVLGTFQSEAATFFAFALLAVAILLPLRMHAPVREASRRWHWALSLAASSYAALGVLSLCRAAFQWIGGQGWDQQRLTLAVLIGALVAWRILREHLRRAARAQDPA